jgi:hypothetical protein
VVSAISFSPDYRAEIGNLLGKIRKIIAQTDLLEPKRDAIYHKIAALQAEVDRSTTRFDALMSRSLDLTNTLGQAVDNLEPIWKLMERFFKVLGRAKADHDQGQLPPPETTKRLPPPESNADFDDLDDEIPF